MSNHGLTRKRAVKGTFGQPERALRSLPAHPEKPGRNLRPQLSLSTPHAASLLIVIGKLKGIGSASRCAVCHPQSAPIPGGLHDGHLPTD